MKIVINLKTENAAFEVGNEEEAARILREAMENILTTGKREKNLFDINGNKVGNYKVTGH